MRIRVGLLLLLALLSFPLAHAFTFPYQYLCVITHWTNYTDKGAEVSAGVMCINASRAMLKDDSFLVRELELLTHAAERSSVSVDQLGRIEHTNYSVFSLKNVELYAFVPRSPPPSPSSIPSFHQYKLDPLPGCFPFRTDREKRINVTTIKIKNNKPVLENETITLYYGECFVDKALFEGKPLTVYLLFRGTELKNGKAGGAEAKLELFIANETLATILAHHFQPTSPICFPTLLIIGLLMAALYYRGSHPLVLLDINFPHLPRAPGISFASVTLGTAGLENAEQTIKESKLAKEAYSSLAEQLAKALRANRNDERILRLLDRVLGEDKRMRRLVRAVLKKAGRKRKYSLGQAVAVLLLYLSADGNIDYEALRNIINQLLSASDEDVATWVIAGCPPIQMRDIFSSAQYRTAVEHFNRHANPLWRFLTQYGLLDSFHRLIYQPISDRNNRTVLPLVYPFTAYAVANRILSYKGRAAGNLAGVPLVGKWVNKALGFLTMSRAGRLLLPDPWYYWVGSIRDMVFAGRFAVEAAKTATSFPVRWALSAIGAYTGEGSWLQRWAALSDDSKIKVGQWFPLEKEVSLQYHRTKMAIYKEVMENIVLWRIWGVAERRLVEQLSDSGMFERFKRNFMKKGLSESEAEQRAWRMLERIAHYRVLDAIRRSLDIRTALADAPLISLLESLKINWRKEFADIIAVVTNNHLTLGEMAQEVYLRSHHLLTPQQRRDIKCLFDELRRIESSYSNDFERLMALSRYLARWAEISPYEQITRGRLFIMAGRSSFLEQEPSSRTTLRDYYFLFGGLNEIVNQWLELGWRRSMAREGAGHISLGFIEDIEASPLDGLKLFYLKLKTLWFGWGDLSAPSAEQIAETQGRIRRFIGRIRRWLSDRQEPYAQFFTATLDQTREDLAYVFFSEGGRRSREEVRRICRAIDERSLRYFRDLLSEQGRQRLGARELTWDTVGELLFPRGLERYRVEEVRSPTGDWKLIMDFAWPAPGSTSPSDRFGLLWQAWALKFKRFTPMDTPMYDMMRHLFDNMFANLVTGEPISFGIYRRHLLQEFPGIEGLHLPGVYGSFEERVRELRYIYYAYFRYFNLNEEDPHAWQELQKRLEKPVTYADMVNKKMPIVLRYDNYYVPYIHGMPLSDYDHIRNAVIMIRGKDGWRDAPIQEILEKGMRDLAAAKQQDPRLRNYIESVISLVTEAQGLPSEDGLNFLHSFVREVIAEQRFLELRGDNARAWRDQTRAFLECIAEMRTLVRRLRRETNQERYDEIVQRLYTLQAQAQEILRGFRSFGLPAEIIGTMESYIRPVRTELTEEEWAVVLGLLRDERLSPEARFVLLDEISRATKEYQRLWSNADFIEVRPLYSAPEEAGWWKRLEISLAYNIGRNIDKWVLQSAMFAAEPLAKEVAVSEYLRTLVHDAYILGGMIYGGDPGTIPTVQVDADLSGASVAFQKWAGHWTRYSPTWGLYITRHPSGSSTQFGKQWYYAAMYHRGPAMPPTLYALRSWAYQNPHFGPESWINRAREKLVGVPVVGKVFDFLIPEAGKTLEKMELNWYRLTTPAWYVNSAFIRPIRNLKSGVLGWPSLYDAEFGPEMRYDELMVADDVPWPQAHVIRSALHPAEMFGGVIGRLFSLGGSGMTQEVERGGAPVVSGVYEHPIHFPQLAGGAAWRRHGDWVNPGLNLGTYRGNVIPEPRITQMIRSDIPWLRDDPWLAMHANYSTIHRKTTGEAKVYHFFREIEGYGPRVNYFWGSVSPLFFGWFGYHRYARRREIPFVSSLTRRVEAVREQFRGQGVAGFGERIQRAASDFIYGFAPRVRRCPICGARMSLDRGVCPQCGYVLRYY